MDASAGGFQTCSVQDEYAWNRDGFDEGRYEKTNVLTLSELIQSARAAGVRFIACDMAMGVMGISREELIEVDEVAGVATFAELSKKGNTLFI